MFGETTISYVKIGNHPIETTIYKWLFGVPGSDELSTHVHTSKGSKSWLFFKKDSRRGFFVAFFQGSQRAGGFSGPDLKGSKKMLPIWGGGNKNVWCFYANF